jgi:hypothetical protein
MSEIFAGVEPPETPVVVEQTGTRVRGTAVNEVSRITGGRSLGRAASFSVLVFANVLLMASTSAPSGQLRTSLAEVARARGYHPTLHISSGFSMIHCGQGASSL